MKVPTGGPVCVNRLIGHAIIDLRSIAGHGNPALRLVAHLRHVSELETGG